MRAVLFFLAFILAGSAMAQAWTAFTPEGGRLRVDLPGAPTGETVPLNSPA